MNRHFRFRTAVFTLTLITAYSFGAVGGERSMGDGAKGEMQDLNSWNNDAMSFAQETGRWKERWSPQKVAARWGELAGEKGVYCLSANGDHKGAELVMSGDKTSKSFEAYLSSHASDSAAKKAYDDHEQRLHEFYAYWKKTHESAHCS